MEAHWHNHIIIHAGIPWEIIDYPGNGKIYFVVGHDYFANRVLITKILFGGFLCNYDRIIVSERLCRVTIYQVKIKHRKKRRVSINCRYITKYFVLVFE